MKRICLLLSVILLLLVSCKEKKDNEYLVTCNLPMTGYVGVYGEWIKNGVSMSLEENRDSLEQNDIDLKIIYDDNRGENKDAITILKKQLMNKPDIVVSGLTGQSMAISEQLTQYQIPHFLFSFTPLTLEKDKFQFRTFANFGVEVEHYIDFIKKNNPEKVAFIYLDIQGTTQQVNDVMIPFLQKNYPEAKVLNERYPTSLMDFKSIVSKVKSFNPDIIIVNGFAGNLISIIKTFHQNNIEMSKIMCSMDLLDTTNELSQDLLEGISVTAPAFVIPAKQTDKMHQWMEAYKQRHGQNPAYTEAYAYDMMNMICKAAILSSKSSKNLMTSLFQVEMDGVTGKLEFAPNGELYPNMYTVKFINGKLME